MAENDTTNVTAEISLADDGDQQPRDFGSVTLELGNNEAAAVEMTEGDCSSTGVVDSRGTVPPVEFEGPGLRRDRPYSASMISRKSVTSTKSQTSLKAGVVTTDYSKAHLFSCRVSDMVIHPHRHICYVFHPQDGSFDKAIDKCKEMIYKEEMDGEMKGAWLLTV